MENFISNFNSLIKNRRSISPQNFSGVPVDDAIIHQLLENASWAPTHGKTEPWYFFVFKGDSMKNLLDLQAKLYQEKTDEAIFSLDKFNKIKKRHEQASHLIVIVCKAGRNPKIPLLEEIEAVACAVQNMQLTATSYNVGAFWATGEMAYYPEIKEELGLAEQDSILGYLYVGVPKEMAFVSSRTSIDLKSEWHI